MKSWILSWENPSGLRFSNQVTAPDRDGAIFRLALLMQTPWPDTLKFLSCVPETSGADIRLREGSPGYSDVTCGSCGGEFGTNMPAEEMQCPHCDAVRCPHCATWFGAQ